MLPDNKYPELVKACLKGNRLAQKALYDQHAGKVMGICLRYSKNEKDAEDLMQESFIKVFKTLKQFRGEGNVGAWIRRIAVNTALERWRQKKREEKYLGTQLNDFENVQLSDDSYDHLELEDILLKIQKLPMGYRTIFNLYAIEGFKHKEISEKLNIKEGTSKSQFARARHMLIKMITEEENMLIKQLNKR